MEDVKDNVFWFTIDGEKRLATKNLVPGKQVYNEKLVLSKGIEYRTWDPFRSKLAASIMNDLDHFPSKRNQMYYILGFPLEQQLVIYQI